MSAWITTGIAIAGLLVQLGINIRTLAELRDVVKELSRSVSALQQFAAATEAGAEDVMRRIRDLERAVFGLGKE